MQIISVLCQRCGAPLALSDGSVRFVTCGHCGTSLEIVREATHAHSRILDQIHAATHENAKTLKVIELQNDLEHLDRQWQVAQKEMCGHNAKTGAVNESPSAGLLMFGMVLLGGSGLMIKQIFDPQAKEKIMFVIAAAVLIGVAVWIIRLAMQQDASFAKVRERYLATRASIILRINRIRKP